ncbi:hypothetical protein NDU88_006781 [Pleurodeles waltl]|uniref:Uncharacterized protein n=1 Tax=Pleurodeles waltl TaxID=8319 RepID=A0AAV7NR53_PLEWA|nr:hypothetical protein NDU88_006781 [Pleurodeles waltl]
MEGRGEEKSNTVGWGRKKQCGGQGRAEATECRTAEEKQLVREEDGAGGRESNMESGVWRRTSRQKSKVERVREKYTGEKATRGVHKSERYIEGTRCTLAIDKNMDSMGKEVQKENS